MKLWRIALGANGLRADFRLRYVGFYPKGGGEFEARILPRGPAPDCVDLPARGTLGQVQVTSMVANLPFHIAERQAHAAQRVLREKGIRSEVEHLPLPSSGSSGSALFIRAEFENTLAGFDALGERGKRAETVGEEAAQTPVLREPRFAGLRRVRSRRLRSCSPLPLNNARCSSSTFSP